MELLYFSSNDLLIKVDYDEESNSLRYWSNRTMETKERIKVEQHLLSEFAMKVEYYSRETSMFSYEGVEKSLRKELNLLHLDNMLKYLVGKEQETEKKIKEVINISLTNYYFEKIGDEIRLLRGELRSGRQPEQLHDLKVKMSELVSAYNLYTNQQLTLEDVVPSDLLNQM